MNDARELFKGILLDDAEVVRFERGQENIPPPLIGKLGLVLTLEHELRLYDPHWPMGKFESEGREFITLHHNPKTGLTTEPGVQTITVGRVHWSFGERKGTKHYLQAVHPKA